MKKMTLNLNAVALSIAGIALLGTAVNFVACRTVSRTEIGIIKLDNVRDKAKVYKMVAEEQKKYDAVVAEKMNKELAPLQAQAEKLEADKAKLTGAEISKQMGALQKKAVAIQTKYRPQFERNMLASQVALKLVDAQIQQAMKATVETTGIDVLLPSNATFYATQKVDVTDVFVKELDKLVQSVTYPDPEKLGAGAQ